MADKLVFKNQYLLSEVAAQACDKKFGHTLHNRR
jgi:hypothetical protein